MKSFILTALLILSAGALLHAADVITLNDGTTLEGKITDEDAATITIKVTPADGGLAVPRIVRRSDIKDIKREGPDIAAFEALEDLVPAPDRLTATEYKERIGRGQAFLNRFADSKHAPAVKKMMAQLEAERKLAASGALKLNGEWIPASTRRKDAYEIDARIELSDMEAALQESRYQLALRQFEKMQTDFTASQHFAKARELAIEALNAYRPAVAADLARVDSRIRTRDEELQRLTSSQRKEEEAIIAARDAAYKRRVKAEQAAKTKWLTVSPYHKGPLQSVLRSIDSTLKALETPLPKDAKMAGPIYRDAWEAAENGNYEGGKDLLSELRSLKVPERYLTELEEQLTPPEPEERSATTRTPEPETVTDPAEEKAEEERKKEEERERKEAEAAAEETQPAAVQEEVKKGFPIQIILVIVLVVVIAGALFAAFGGKKH